MSKIRKASISGQNAWGLRSSMTGQIEFALKWTQAAAIIAAKQLGLVGTIERVQIKPTNDGGMTGWAAVETSSGDFTAAILGKKSHLENALATLAIDMKGLQLVRMKFGKAKVR